MKKVVAMVAEARADQGVRRAAAGLVLAAAPALYAVPAGAAQYTLAWMWTFGDQTGQILLQAGMALGCIFIPLAGPVCVALSAA